MAGYGGAAVVAAAAAAGTTPAPTRMVTDPAAALLAAGAGAAHGRPGDTEFEETVLADGQRWLRTRSPTFMGSDAALHLVANAAGDAGRYRPFAPDLSRRHEERRDAGCRVVFVA